MLARHVPYAVGVFMLIPLALWLFLWLVAFPGPKQGLGGPLSVALGLVSLPLVSWFYISTLGMLSNSIERRNPFERPRHYGLGYLIASLPWIALAVGAGAAPYLVVAYDLSWPLAALPFGLSVVIAVAIVAGERTRPRDHETTARAASLDPSRRRALRQIGRLALAVVYAVPVVGRLLREAVEGGDHGWAYFALNLVLASIVAVILFGYPALITIALVACGIVSAMILTIAAA